MACEEAIILVGGRGTRLRSVVSDVPKPLAQVAGRPFLAYVLDGLAKSSIRRCILATGYLADIVEGTIGKKWLGMEVVYSVEDQPMGTGGATAHAVAERLMGNSTHVLNGDTYLRYSPDLLELRTREAGTTAGVALAQVDNVSRYGAVIVSDGRVVSFEEKGGLGCGLINAGSYFLSNSALAILGRKSAPFSLETEVLMPLARERQIAAFIDTEQFIDIGVPEDYELAQSLLRRGLP